VSLTAANQAPIVFDLGTGLTPFGELCDAPFNGAALLSHLHWDHVQGLPFFRPLHKQGASLDIYGPRQDGGSLGDVFEQLMSPPFFPIRPGDLGAEIRFHDTVDDDFPIGLAKVRSRWVRHTGPTLGFRVECNGVSVAYIPDHGPGCCPDDADDFIPRDVLELCDGVDVLIHDAQHTNVEYGPKRHWGHCTVDYAVHVARESGAHRLVLFHHDPLHGDDDLDGITQEACEHAATLGAPDVIAAYEGLELDLQPSAGVR
jgi:phosphoribosyl 1,2-cyclic phosphodiesterase